MEPLRDFAQLQLCFVDQSQWRYELIRPLVLFEGGTATQRAEETPTHPQTVRKLMRHFAQQGLLGLLPDNLDVMPPSRVRPVPEAVVEEIARLKALYAGLHYREVARLMWYKVGYRVDDKTVKALWHQSAPAAQGELALGHYHRHPDRDHARVEVIKLYDQGWNKRSISRVLHISPSTVHLWIARFEAEHFAGLVDHSRAPQAPARKVWLPLMVDVYHLQKRHADDCEAVCQRLQIHHERIVSTQGDSYKNLLETHFNIQRRLFDNQFSLTTTPAEFEQVHQPFMQTYHTTAHQGLLNDQCDPPIPLKVLGQTKGRLYTPNELMRKFSQALFPRTTNLPGCVTIHSYHFYVEQGVPQTQVPLWVSDEQLRAVLDNVVLAEYHCRYD